MENQNQMNQKQQAQDERKTVVNGKVVSLQQAQQMEEQVNQNNQTGIQEHHNNQSESVKAGEVGQNVQAQEQQVHNIKQVNVQSGQSHFEGVQANGMTENQKMQKQDHDAVQQSLNAKGTSSKAKANTKKVD